MIRAIRSTRSASAFALTVLACVMWVSTSALLHDETDDLLCSVVLEPHDHSAHRIGADPVPTPSADHCFVCHSHSLRSLASTVLAWSPGRREARLSSRIQTDAGITVARPQHARAPPLA